MPPVVRDLVLGRLEHLGAGERSLLELIAVAGDAAGLAVLERASGREASAIAAALRQLCEAGLVVEEHGGPQLAYRAAHPLFAEVADAELTEATRRRLHAAVATVLEEVRPDDLERLAHHYRGAATEVDPDRAVDVLLAAAERADRVHAAEEAAGYLTAALDLARAHRPALVGTLLERAGEAWRRGGRITAAVAAWREAVEMRVLEGDVRAAARLHSRLALAEWDRGAFRAAERELAAGLRILAGVDAVAELTDLHYARLQLLTRAGDTERVETEAATLLDLAGRSGAPQALAAARLAQADLAFHRGRSVAREQSEAGLAVAERAGLTVLVGQINRHLGVIALGLGELDVARRRLGLDLEQAERSGVPTLQLSSLMIGALIDLVTGDWMATERAGRRIERLGRRVGAPRGVAAGLGYGRWCSPSRW